MGLGRGEGYDKGGVRASVGYDRRVGFRIRSEQLLFLKAITNTIYLIIEGKYN